MFDTALQARILRVGEVCRRRGIGQAQIAQAVGASQSQVSRILNGRGLRRSRLAEDVCRYVEAMEGGVSIELVRENNDLLEALRTTWDGTQAHAKALSNVIRSLAGLRPACLPDLPVDRGDR